MCRIFERRMPRLNQLKGHEATFGVLLVDSPLDHVFLITSLAQFRKRFGSGCHPIIAPVSRILKLDLNVSPRLALRRLLLVLLQKFAIGVNLPTNAYCPRTLS